MLERYPMGFVDTIITHSGIAHVDDFLSCAIAIANYPSIKTLRRISSEEYSKLIYAEKITAMILDIGKVYKHTANEFDHHQLDQNDKDIPECTFTLLCKSIFNLSVEELCKILPQVYYLTIRDNFGPKYAYKKVFSKRNPLYYNDIIYPTYELSSLVENSILEAFSSINYITKGDTLWYILEFVGKHLTYIINSILEFRSNSNFEYLNNGNIIYIDQVIPNYLWNTFYQVLADKNIYPKVILSLNSQDTSQIVANRSRYASYIDFNDLELGSKDKTSFIHSSGFMAVFNSNTSLEEIEIILKKDII